MNFTFENQGTNTYLVYNIGSTDQVDAMSLGMLTNNKIDGLAQALFMQVDTEKYVKYNVSAKVSVRQFFSGIVNKKRLIGVFKGIVNAMLSAEDYMIDTNNIILDFDYIFTDVTTCETVLICLPIIVDKPANEGLDTFFKNIMFTTQFDQTENCDYVAQIINFLNGSPVFYISDFQKLLNNIDSAKSEAANNHTKMTANVASQHVIKQPLQHFDHPTSQRAPTVSRSSVNQAAPVNTPQAQASIRQSIPQPPVTQMPSPAMPQNQFQQPMAIPSQNQFQQPMTAPPVQSPYYPPNNGVPPFQPVVPDNGTKKKGLFGGIFGGGDKKSAKEKNAKKNKEANKKSNPNVKKPAQPRGVPSMAIPGFAIPGAPAEYTPSAPLKTENVPGVSAPSNPGFQPVQKTAPSEPVIQNTSASANNVQSFSNSQPTYIQQPTQGTPMNFGDTTVLSAARSDTTVLNAGMLSHQTVNPYLVRLKNKEQISINKPVFRIGKERSYVDFFIGDNTAISRSHAAITSRDGVYYITDTNSTNHTLLLTR